MSETLTGAGLAERVAAAMRDVPDFPAPGILFKDFTPVLLDVSLRDELIAALARQYEGQVDLVAGIEARGFMLGGMLAQGMDVGFVPIRKAGKLPRATYAEDFSLEYGTASIEVHTDAFELPSGAPARVLVVDDILATGGTAAAACRLVERTGAQVVGVDVILEIAALGGRQVLAPHTVSSVVVS